MVRQMLELPVPLENTEPTCCALLARALAISGTRPCLLILSGYLKAACFTVPGTETGSSGLLYAAGSWPT